VSELLRLALVGIVGGLVVFALITPVAVVLQRRRFGRWRPLRLLGVAVICMYTMSLAGLTVAPAYEVAATCSRRAGGELRAVPFDALGQILSAYRDGATGLSLLAAWPTTQLLANIALFVPLGAILRGVFRLEITNALAIGVMLSVLIEATQYSGAWGLYPCGVRIADIDDVFANSLGAWVGALCAPLLVRLRVPLFGREERHWPEAGG
jgi:glycopeptide antibiotics resistance protein